MYKYVIVFLLCLIAKTTLAQRMEGRVYEEKTHNGLPNITVTNLRTQQQTQTLKYGAFIINARVNDMLLFTGIGFKPDTILLTDVHAKEVYMTPIATQLAEVKIQGQSQANQQAFAMPKDRDFHNQTLQYQMDDTGGYKGGVSLRIWSSKKGERDRKKEAAMLHNDAISSDIAKAFDPDNIAKFLPLKDKELEGFVVRYTPNVATFTDPAFNYTAYLNKCYKEFMQLPAEERVKTDIFGKP